MSALPCLEESPDRPAASAPRGQIDWKQLRGLPVYDPGFDLTTLADCRARLVEDGAERPVQNALLDALLEVLRATCEKQRQM